MNMFDGHEETKTWSRLRWVCP